MQKLIIKTDVSFKDISLENGIEASVGTKGIELEHFHYDKYNVPAIRFTPPAGNEIILREDYFQRIKDAGCYVKVDFSVTKPRRLNPEDLKKELNPITSTNSYSNNGDMSQTFDPESLTITTKKLVDMDFDPRLKQPIETGTYFDNFASRKGGIMPGTNTMVTGDPGVGKSSNLMDIQTNIVKNDPSKRVLYVSGEMKPIDVDEFVEFYPGLENADFFYISDYLLDPENTIPTWQALMSILHEGWDLVILDSIVEVQSVAADELGLTGKKAERWVLDLMAKHNQGYNKRNLFTAFLAIQQMNKSGNYVGSKRLEHMTDAFLQLKWCTDERGKRYMEYSKNRKGKEKIKLYYQFGDGDGIKYAEQRHIKELETMNILQKSGYDVEEMDEDSFFDVFKKAEEERLEAEAARN